MGRYDDMRLERVQLELVSTSNKPLRDYSAFWNLPFEAKDVAFVINNGNELPPVDLGWASSTEGRSFHLEGFVYKFKGGKFSEMGEKLPYSIPDGVKKGKYLRPVVCNDMQIKGGGFPENHKSSAIAELERSKKKKINYLRRSDIGRHDSGPPAGSSLNYDLSLDETFSVLYHSWGGRTRLPIATYPLESLNFPEGNLTVNEARKIGYFKEGDQPVTAGWGMRCRWRIDDIVTYFSSKEEKSTSGGSSLFKSMLHPSVQFYETEEIPSKENAFKAKTFAQEITSRVKYDEDVRWRRLGEKYSEVNDVNLAEFYLDYLTILSRSIGEQIGLLYKKDVVLYMLNFQNFSALGEVFDFDIAVFKGKKFIDGVELTREDMKKYNVLNEKEERKGKDPDSARFHAVTSYSAMIQLTQLFATLRIPGIINTDGDEFKKRYDHAMAEFGRGIVEKGFGNNPSDFLRNIRYVDYFDKIQADQGMFNMYPNPIAEALKYYNKFSVDVIKRKFTKGRSLYPGALKNFAS